MSAGGDIGENKSLIACPLEVKGRKPYVWFGDIAEFLIEIYLEIW